MLKHCIKLSSAIRLGMWIGDVVGPFDTIEAAEKWYNELVATAKVEVPDAICTTLLDPNS